MGNICCVNFLHYCIGNSNGLRGKIRELDSDNVKFHITWKSLKTFYNIFCYIFSGTSIFENIFVLQKFKCVCFIIDHCSVSRPNIILDRKAIIFFYIFLKAVCQKKMFQFTIFEGDMKTHWLSAKTQFGIIIIRDFVFQEEPRFPSLSLASFWLQSSCSFGMVLSTWLFQR